MTCFSHLFIEGILSHLFNLFACSLFFFFFSPYVILYFTAVQKKRRKNLQDRKKKKRNLTLMIKVHKLKHHLLPSPPHRLSKHTGKLKKARVLLQLKGFHSTEIENDWNDTEFISDNKSCEIALISWSSWCLIFLCETRCIQNALQHSKYLKMQFLFE